MRIILQNYCKPICEIRCLINKEQFQKYINYIFSNKNVTKIIYKKYCFLFSYVVQYYQVENHTIYKYENIQKRVLFYVRILEK